MEALFSSAKKAYYDNYVQFALTADPRYQRAYQEAEASIKQTLEKMNVQDEPEQHHDREIHNRSRTQMGRLEIQSTPPMPSLTFQYILSGVLGAIAVGLMMF